MDADLRETLRRRHEARLAEERRIRDEADAARLAAEEEARQIARREVEEQSERLVPLVQLHGELLDLISLVRTAQRPGQVLPALRRVAASVQNQYQPDIPGASEVVGEIQAAVMELVLAFNDNEGLVLQVGSYEFRTIQELIQTITTTTGVDIEIAAPVMDTSRDEEIARQLAGPQQPAAYYQEPQWQAAPQGPASAPVRVNDGAPELAEYRDVLNQLRTTRYASQSQVHAILRQVMPPPDGLGDWQRNQLRTLLQNMLTYVRNRWGSVYQLEEQIAVLEEFIAML